MTWMDTAESVFGNRNAVIVHGDARSRLAELPSGLAHICVTSPPYWFQRSYIADDHPDKPLELGRERSPQEWCDNQVAVFREVRRVLLPWGVLWLNVGSCYSSGDRKTYRSGASTNKGWQVQDDMPRPPTPPGYKPLDLVDLPSILAESLRADGWYYRSRIVWRKRAPLPSSVRGWRWERCRVRKKRLRDNAALHRRDADISPVTSRPWAQWETCPGCDRCRANGGWVLRKGSWRPTGSHEIILQLTPGDTYFCDSEAAAEPAETATIQRERYSRITANGKTDRNGDDAAAVKHDHESLSGGKRNPRDVQTFKASYNKAEHYACFPLDLPTRFIKFSMSEKGYCPECAMPMARMVEHRNMVIDRSGRSEAMGEYGRIQPSGTMVSGATSETVGWMPSCSCNTRDQPVSGICLDPYAGTGTTVLAAILSGHRGLGVELSSDYCRIAERRIRARAGLFT